jgi:hypothetical protein
VTRSSFTDQPSKHLVVPRENGSWLTSPSANRASQLVLANAAALANSEIELQGCSLTCLRTRTRYAVLNAARRYTSGWVSGLDNANLPPMTNWVVGGHQPALFHPGVWAKNFAVSRLASRNGSVSLNLIVDNDTLASPAIRVPSGILANPQAIDIPFDLPQSKQPWENIKVQDMDLFRSFPRRVREALQGWDLDPLLESFWPRVLDFYNSTPSLADAFSAARNQQEREWGATNLELPLSRLCQLPSFLWFTCHILAHLPRFREVYNSAVRNYRLANHIHSTSHPVPELAQSGDRFEAPFWVWRKGETRRSRLFAQQRGPLLILTKDDGELLAELPLTAESHAQPAVDRLQELEAQGISIRTRALTTTLFSRIFLADLFVHGIGGAKYDEITDQLISQFFHLPVPAYWVVTGTLHLPLGKQPATNADLARDKRHLWDLQWNPATALSGRSEQPIRDLCREFQEQLRQPVPDLASRRVRHRALTEIKAAFSKWTSPEVPEAKAQIEQTNKQLTANRILQNRDYSSVLYPANLLQDFLNT